MIEIRDRDLCGERFVQIRQSMLRDPLLSARAKGVLCYLKSHLDGYELSKEAVLRSFTEGRDALQQALKELKTHGYLQIEKIPNGWRWSVSDRGQHADFQSTENPQETDPNAPVPSKMTNPVQHTENPQGQHTENPSFPTIDENTNKKKKRTPPAEAAGTSLPHGRALAKAWEDWCQHRKEIRKKLTPTSIKQQLRKLGSMREVEAVKMIEYTISMGWQGLREPEVARGGPRTERALPPPPKASKRPTEPRVAPEDALSPEESAAGLKAVLTRTVETTQK